MSPILQSFGNADLRAFGWSRGAASGGNALELISTQILAGNATSITFSSIPGTYKHLQIRYVARTDTASQFSNVAGVRFNGDATTNYYSHNLQNATAGNTGGLNTNAQLGRIGAAATVTGSFGAGVVDVLDYTSTSKNKTVRSFSGHAATDAFTTLFSGAWFSTSAITSLTIVSQLGGNFIAGSRFSVYGVLG